MTHLPSANPLRSAAGIVLACFGLIVLAISAHIENGIRHNFVSSSTFTYPAFVGALTVVGETALVVFRWKRIVRPLTIVAVEVAWTVLLWIFWIAAAANTTSVTSGLLDYCGRINLIANSTCSEVKALVAFLWLGWLLYSIVLGWLLTLAIREHMAGNRSIWRSSLANYLDNTYDEKHVGASAGADPVVHSQPVGSVPMQATSTTATGTAHHPTTATAV